jgi:7-dehydrocholesterol reductase
MGHKIVLGWFAIQLALLVILPGKKFLGHMSETGHRPEYKLNGVLNYFVSMFGYLACVKLGLINGGFLFDHMGSMLVSVSIIAPILIVFLYFKGKYAPSSKDCESSGNILTDLYWGVELYPEFPFTNLSFKQIINCRYAMMGWNILILSFMLKQLEQSHIEYSTLVSFVIQSVYIFKFFVWEDGYFNSIDIMHDKFGFYICWGVMVWLPMIYTMVSFYLTAVRVPMSALNASVVVVLGVFSVWANFDADNQRLKFRFLNGDLNVWGKKAEYIVAKYKTTDGKNHESKFLVSGWWGIARHFNYVLELLLAFFWTLPVGFNCALPWFYFVFLCILLTDRSVRDDTRCSYKYGKDFTKYCARVRYRMIPYVF